MTSNDVLADQTRVNVLQKPSDFYQALESLITTAKTRLVISALYLGEGHLEAHLLDLIDDAISSKSLKVDIILDHSRFQRDSQSTVRTHLCKIIASHPQNITISLYEMPQLRSFPVSQLPYWLKEIAAVYHCKFIISDNQVLITGANLSDDYFTIRQDRYWLFTPPTTNHPLPTYLKYFSDTIISSSYQLSSSGGLLSPKQVDSLSAFFASHTNQIINLSDGITIQPVIQHSFLGMNSEENVLLNLIKESSSQDLIVCSPYTNFTSSLIKTLIQHHNKSQQTSSLTIISPVNTAHGFYGGRGLKSYLPALHESLLSPLLNSLITCPHFTWLQFTGQDHITQLHAKGIWSFTASKNQDNGGGCWSYIGSSNLSRRSWRRDFELGIILSASKKSNVKQLMEQELQSGLYAMSKKVSVPIKKHSLWIRVVARILKSWL